MDHFTWGLWVGAESVALLIYFVGVHPLAAVVGFSLCPVVILTYEFLKKSKKPGTPVGVEAVA